MTRAVALVCWRLWLSARPSGWRVGWSSVGGGRDERIRGGAEIIANDAT
jgi:hypothetical protein